MGTARTRRGPRGGEEGDTEPGPPGINPPSVLPCEIGHPQIQGWQSSGTPAGGSGRGGKAGPGPPLAPPGTHVVMEGLGLAGMLAGLPAIRGGAVQIPKNAGERGGGRRVRPEPPPIPTPISSPAPPAPNPTRVPPPSAGASRLPALFSLETVARAGAQIPGTLHQCEHPGLGWPGGGPLSVPPPPWAATAAVSGCPPRFGGCWPSASLTPPLTLCVSPKITR